MIERYKQSLLIIKSQIDHSGGIVAANDTDISQLARDTYSYVWPRDGALVSSALMHAGHAGAPERFLGFCSRVISPNGYLRHKYNPDGTSPPPGTATCTTANRCFPSRKTRPRW